MNLAMDTAKHTIPVELKQWPRRVRRRHWYNGVGVWFTRLFILPHILVGAGLALAIPGRAIWRVAGTDIDGVATQISIHHSSKGGTSYSMTYNYRWNGIVRSASRSINSTQFSRLQGGNRIVKNQADIHVPVRVRTAGIGRFVYAEPILEGDNEAGNFFLMFFMAAFWNGITWIFGYLFWISPWRIHRLYKKGTPALGTITDKTTTRGGKGSTYYNLLYEFETPATGKAKGKQTVSFAQWDQAHIGDEVTVLHWEGKAKPSVIYEYGPYICLA